MSFYQFPFDVDVTAIRAEIKENGNAWRYSIRNTLPAQQHTDTIELRMTKSRMGVRARDTHDVVDNWLYHFFPATKSFIDFFLTRYGGKCGRINIVKLHLHKKVPPHIDDGAYYRAIDRFHLAISGMYEYVVDGESHIITPGTLFWFDSQKVHEAKAIGTQDRLAVIFDVAGAKFK